MSDDPKIEETEEMDEIDKFLATLPSLHIPDDMVEDADFPPQTGKSHKSVPLTSIFGLLAWVIIAFALLTASRAGSSSGMPIFGALLNRSSYSSRNPEHLFSAMCYLFGNCAVCLGGLAICLAKRMKMTSGGALNLWIAGGLSAILAIVLMVMQ